MLLNYKGITKHLRANLRHLLFIFIFSFLCSNEDSHRMEVIPTIYTKPPGSSSKVVGLQSSAAADHEYEDPEKLFSKPVYAEVGPPLVNKKACMNLYSIESCDVHKIPK